MEAARSRIRSGTRRRSSSCWSCGPHSYAAMGTQAAPRLPRGCAVSCAGPKRCRCAECRALVLGRRAPFGLGSLLELAFQVVRLVCAACVLLGLGFSACLARILGVAALGLLALDLREPQLLGGGILLAHGGNVTPSPRSP